MHKASNLFWCNSAAMKIWSFSFEYFSQFQASCSCKEALGHDNIKYTLDGVEILQFSFFTLKWLSMGGVQIRGVDLTFGVAFYHDDPNLFFSPLWAVFSRVPHVLQLSQDPLTLHAWWKISDEKHFVVVRATLLCFHFPHIGCTVSTVSAIFRPQQVELVSVWLTSHWVVRFTEVANFMCFPPNS